MSQLRDLARKFPADSIQDNPTGYGSYVPHHLYVQRLLMHLGGYDFELVHVLRGDAPGKAGKDPLVNVVVGVVMRLRCDIDGRTTVVEEVGDCEIPSNWDTDGKRLKDAMSDALKRCCARIGLGTHLYAKNVDDYVLYRVLTDNERQADGADAKISIDEIADGSPT